ncbi:Holliday junction resolvase RuvX [Dokdonella soli]|uniref:Putative pre-16S rRNA nuclease n=1 Tax=Dokdonella soli TaxID=529810 RepID=A0ABP3TSV7_9GAMM
MPATPEKPASGFNPGSVLAFDYGTRLIGVAVGHRVGATARALTTLANGDWQRLDGLIVDWRPEHCLVGLPLALDGSEQPMSRAAREFATALHRRYALTVHLVDERYTSGEAARRFAERRARGSAKRKDAAAIDALAAEIILETWLAQAGHFSP